jgi:hypothetical protein
MLNTGAPDAAALGDRARLVPHQRQSMAYEGMWIVHSYLATSQWFKPSASDGDDSTG